MHCTAPVYTCAVCQSQEKMGSLHLKIHIRDAHGLDLPEYYWRYVLELDQPPICECGCGKPVEFIKMHRGFRRFASNSCFTRFQNRQPEFNARLRARSSELGKRVMSENGTRLAQFKREHEGRTPAEDIVFKELVARGLCVIHNDMVLATPYSPRLDLTLRDFKIDIELDGMTHKHTKKEDHERDEYVKSCGWRVLRFSNQEVYENTDAVIEKILFECGFRYIDET